MVKRTVVLIVWHDAHAASDGWCDVRDIDAAPCVVHTVGWLVPDGKAGHVMVAQTVAEDDDLYAVFCVPVGMIKSMQVIS